MNENRPKRGSFVLTYLGSRSRHYFSNEHHAEVGDTGIGLLLVTDCKQERKVIELELWPRFLGHFQLNPTDLRDWQARAAFRRPWGVFPLTDTAISSEKIAAYRATHYQVGKGTETFTLRIDAKSDSLPRLYKMTGQSCGLFITAFNPYGRAQSAETNEAANSQLGHYLRTITPHIIEGAGSDPTEAWSEEMSFFALGIGDDAAQRIGTRFNQDAVVWAGPDAIPRLLLLR
jgi:hypothetical protein